MTFWDFLIQYPGRAGLFFSWASCMLPLCAVMLSPNVRVKVDRSSDG